MSAIPLLQTLQWLLSHTESVEVITKSCQALHDLRLLLFLHHSIIALTSSLLYERDSEK